MEPSKNNTINVEEYLRRNDSLTYTNVGVSMLPLLRQGRDLFTVVRKGEERCKVGDVVLYKRHPDKYVLHRVVKVREKDYVILGDNCVKREYVPEQDILGVMTGFCRKGKDHSVEEPAYQLYVRVWRLLTPLRITWKSAKQWIKRLVRGIWKADRR